MKSEKNEAAEPAQAPRVVVGYRYINPNYTIPGVPARDLDAGEAARYGARISETHVQGRVPVYEEMLA